MKFVKSLNPMAVATAVISATSPSTLNINDASSVKSVAKTIASGTMSYYQGNAQQFVDLPKPHYWWQAGALMGTMLDYSHYTGDTSYDQVVATALLAQVGPNFDFMLPAHYGDEGNDDQAFWGFAVMAAAERNFPQPNTNVPSWLQLGTNLWNSLASRWNTTACDGGLLWQIFASNPNGLDYKNSVSNGGFFQISARLARATGNATYLEWAEKVWDWTQGVGMIDTSYNVHDGASASHNCTDTNPVTFSYSAGIYIYGAAVLANHTGDAKWAQRAEQLLQASRSFFSPFPNATDIMYEHACEQVGSCNTDMRSFKAYFSRFVYAASVFVPALQSTINELWHPSALAAAKSCSGGGAGGTACGQRWYAGGFDGVAGLGEQQCALETVQGLLVGQAAPPLRGGDIKTVRTFAASSTASKRGRYDARAV